MIDFAKLAAPFPPSEIKWKPVSWNKDRSRALVLPYVDARAVMDRLDEVVGPFWWNDYMQISGTAVVCTLTITDHETGKTCSKTDVGVSDGQGENAIKSAFSDALKRTAVKFGVGRYLYQHPKTWVDCEDNGYSFKEPPAPGFKLAETLKTPPPSPPEPPKAQQPPSEQKAAPGPAQERPVEKKTNPSITKEQALKLVALCNHYKIDQKIVVMSLGIERWSQLPDYKYSFAVRFILSEGQNVSITKIPEDVSDAVPVSA
jgi:hypothetical protein